MINRLVLIQAMRKFSISDWLTQYEYYMLVEEYEKDMADGYCIRCGYSYCGCWR